MTQPLKKYKEKDFGTKSILRFTGGKQRLVKKLQKSMPEKWNDYFEPFLGGGSLFFSTQSNDKKQFYLNDQNNYLIDTYISIRDNPTEIYEYLKDIANQHSEDFYLKMRDKFNTSKESSVSKSAIFLYLNRSCFNGVFRLNSKQEFKVPSGKKETILIPTIDNFKNLSKKFSSTILTSVDFEKSLDKVKQGTLFI